MNVLQINSVCGYGSTGRIAADLYRHLLVQGNGGAIAYGRGNAPGDIQSIRIGSDADVNQHGIFSRLTDKHGFYSRRATERFVEEAKKLNPDVIHLHNLHGYYLHLPTLFQWLKEVEKPVVWTLHDCWAFTGHCAHFDYVGCEKWKTHCHHCPQKSEYPSSVLADNSCWNYEQKRALFTGLQNLTLVTPSEWLAVLARQSFLGEYPVRVIANGIDLNVFRPTTGNFRERYGLHKHKIALGVASIWTPRKGLQTLLQLADQLGDDWKVVVVGVTEKQKATLPPHVLGISRTNSVEELAQIYTAADVFVNPTLEDNFPTTNLESLACGTPVVTFATGGSPESVDASCGAIVEKSDVAGLAREIIRLAEIPHIEAHCLEHAQLYDKNSVYARYVQLYLGIQG